MKFSVFQVTRRGGRVKNEDRMGYCYTRESGLFLLADGMGGHPEGEVAAQMALQTIAALFQREARPVLKDVTSFLASATMTAHQQIMRYAGNRGMLDTPRTTLVAAVIQGGHATWLHCGDSRLYVVRDGVMLKRTRDHSHVQELLNRGEINARQAVGHRESNLLTGCLGMDAEPPIDLSSIAQLEVGDVILSCTDGLWAYFPDTELAKLTAALTPVDACRQLLDAARTRAAGKGDNVSLAIVKVGPPSKSVAAEEESSLLDFKW